MRFYSQSYGEVLKLPLRTFWSLSANVVRVRAEEQMSLMDLHLLGGMGASQEIVTALQKKYEGQMGDTATSKNKPSAFSDAETTKTGLEQLRKLKGKMVN